MIHYDKLVRDKIPAIIEAAGKTAVTDKILPENMQAALDRKLQEEVKEYLESHSVEEMADLLEVMMAVAKARGSSIEEVEKIRQQKADKRGGFEKKILLEEVRIV